MKDVDLPDGPGSRLVRGFAACLSSVTETPLANLPPLTGGERLAQALGAWKVGSPARAPDWCRLAISNAFAVASLDPVLPQPQQPALSSGTVEQIAIASDAEAPMQIITSGHALAGRGLEGDRYVSNAGTFSPRAGTLCGSAAQVADADSQRKSPNPEELVR